MDYLSRLPVALELPAPIVTQRRPPCGGEIQMAIRYAMRAAFTTNCMG